MENEERVMVALRQMREDSASQEMQDPAASAQRLQMKHKRASNLKREASSRPKEVRKGYLLRETGAAGASSQSATNPSTASPTTASRFKLRKEAFKEGQDGQDDQVESVKFLRRL